MRSFLASKVTRMDFIVWGLVLAFFGTAALTTEGDLARSFLGAMGLIGLMLLIGSAVEVIIECVKEVRGIGTIVGFITNGPEALCLLVGLFITKDLLFAASTPLGSNIINPIMLLIAGLVTGTLALVARNRPLFTAVGIVLTAALAVVFYLLPPEAYWLWALVTVAAGLVLFLKRPAEPAHADEESQPPLFRPLWLVPAILVLLAAGYLLDPVVQFTATHSHAPSGIIGFVVLSTLTSWPEFKSTVSLLNRKMYLASILNIVVSNITNLWLGASGVIYYLLS